MSIGRICFAMLLGLGACLELRADEVDNQQELLLQQERQKQIQAETDYIVRRMGTMLRVLDFYQLDKASEKKMVEEAITSNWVAPIGPDLDSFEAELAEAFDESALPWKVDLVDRNMADDRFGRIIDETAIALD